MIKTNALYANYTIKNKSTMTIAMAIMFAALVGIATILANISNNNAFALDGVCPLGHQCHCIAATGVYYDFDPGTRRTFSINTACTEDNR